jgi:uncharacterized protein (DUF305 family)
MTRLPTPSLTVALLAAAVAACGGATRMEAQTPHHHPHPPARADSLGTGARLADGSHPWTEADAQFMSAMIGHHAQAVEMSRLAPTRASTPAVLRLAERIINAQQDEIAAMQLWLRDRGQPVPEASSAAHHHGGDHGAMMPGMLTPEQMAQLERARGPEFDRLFLTLMIQHHRGAVSMVRQLFGSYGAAQDESVFKFASDVNVDQTTEIERMRSMLVDLTFGSPSP